MNDLRIVLRSTDCVDYYKDNKTYNFRVKLNKPLNLDGSWKIASTDFAFSSTKYFPRQESLYFFSNICQDSLVGCSSITLLRSVFLYNKTDSAKTFANPYYIPVKIGYVNEIHIYITDHKNNLTSLLDGTSTVTLHLKQQLF